jgi:hypothetical protein
MAIRGSVEKIEDVPETLREEYKFDGGSGRFVLIVEGLPEVEALKSKVNEFRGTNVKALKDLEAAQKALEGYKGIDPVKYRELAGKVKDFEDQLGAKDPAGVLALVQRQVTEALAPVQEKLRVAEEREAQKSAALAKKNVESALRDAAVRAGVADPALPDFLARGQQVFTYEDDHVIARNADGSPVFSKVKVGTEMTPEEWARGLSATAPHLFAESRGGGAPGGSGGEGGARGDGGWVDATNPLEMGRNLEDLASGKKKASGLR